MSRSQKALVNTEELGRAIRRRRDELSLSLRDVADKTGVSASTLSRIENGTGKPDADNIARLDGLARHAHGARVVRPPPGQRRSGRRHLLPA